MYLIKGNENYFILQEIEKIKNSLLKEYGEELEIYNFSLNINIDEAINLITNVEIFSNKKLIIFKDLDFLNAKIKKDKKEIDEFLYLLAQVPNDVEIIFSYYIEKYDRNFLASPIFKFLENNAINIEVSKISDRNLLNFVNKLIVDKGGQIEQYALVELLSFLPNDICLIENEINKLLSESKNITLDMIENNNMIISSNIDFAFSDAIIKFNNTANVLRKFDEQINYGVSPIQIINQISNVLNDAQQLYFEIQNNNTLDEISKSWNVHIFRIKLISGFLNKLGYERIKELIIKLALLDSDIKKGLIDDYVGIKTFILDLVK
ncbi:DNA polymerase III subunit delta [Metamycoplasma buccale]|uniref:DNA polymerase III subunit delta n=1 Tax=Metamycoplasma buccale TaxID=55602 RepID=UPI00398F6A4F